MEDYEKEDALVIQKLFKELGYEFSLEDVCEFWREYSELHSAHWMMIHPNEDYLRHLEKSLRRYITHLRADALETLVTFPQEPR